MDPQEQLKKEAARIICRAARVPEKDVIRHLEKPPGNIESDLAFPCFVLAKKLKKDPKTIAQSLAKARPSGVIREIRALGPYANFHADWGRLGQAAIQQVLKERDRYGSGKPKKQSILLEHTSANPDGPLHLGHFRNSVLGDSIARILGFSGYNVKTDFFVNDTGRQIAIAAMEYQRKKPKPEGKPDHWVASLYIRGNRELEKNPDLERGVTDLINSIERGDKTLSKDFPFLTERCLEGHKQTLKTLDITHDSFTRESRFIQDGSLDRLLKRFEKLPQGKKKGGRLWLDLKKFGIDREFTLTREDGTSIYPARDLAYHQDKFARADLNVNIIGTDQRFYFRQLTSALGLLFPKKTESYQVVFYEFLLLPEGSMSTRAGRFIAIDDVLEKGLKAARKLVREKMPDYVDRVQEEISRIITIGALKYAMVKVEPQKTYAFSVEDTLKFEGNNAPYLQYTHARASSILRKGRYKPGRFDASRLTEPQEKALLQAIMGFPRAVSDAARDLRPHYIANYAYQLATQFNDLYQAVRVLQVSDPRVKTARLALVKAFQLTIMNALSLLGIRAPERM